MLALHSSWTPGCIPCYERWVFVNNHFERHKGELNPKIKFVLFERTLKITAGVSYLSVFDSFASFLRYFSFFDMQITYMT